MSTQALRERIAALSKEANHLLAEKGSQVWSKDDQAKFDGLMDERDRAQKQLEAHQRALDEDAEKNFNDAKRKDGRKLSDAERGMDAWARVKADRYTPEQQALVHNTMSTTTSSEGGYTVMPKVASTFIDLMKGFQYVRRVSDNVTTDSGEDMSWPSTDGTAEVGEILAQNASASDLDVSFGTRALNTFKYSSKVITVPVELLQDSQIDIVGLVFKRARDRIGRKQNQGYSYGTGTGEPFGISVASSVGKVGATGQTTTIIYDDLVDVVDSLDAAYLEPEVVGESGAMAEPGWMFSQTLRRTIRKIKDTAGRPIWTPSYDEGAAAATPDRLLGYPVYLNNDMPAPAANAKSLAFGNYRRYMIRDVNQVWVMRYDDSAYMKKGQVGFHILTRGGGNLMDVNSIKLYQHSAT